MSYRYYIYIKHTYLNMLNGRTYVILAFYRLAYYNTCAKLLSHTHTILFLYNGYYIREYTV